MCRKAHLWKSSLAFDRRTLDWRISRRKHGKRQICRSDSPTEFLKCRLSPDAEPANVTAWGELQQVQDVNLVHNGLTRHTRSLKGRVLQYIYYAISSLKQNASYVWKINLDGIDTRDVPESLGDTLVLVIDYEGAQLLHMAPAPQLTLAGAHTAGSVNPKH